MIAMKMMSSPADSKLKGKFPLQHHIVQANFSVDAARELLHPIHFKKVRRSQQNSIANGRRAFEQIAVSFHRRCSVIMIEVKKSRAAAGRYRLWELWHGNRDCCCCAPRRELITRRALQPATKSALSAVAPAAAAQSTL